jgi:hypothetical protein
MSERTKRLGKLNALLVFLSTACNVAPLAAYVIIAFLNADLVVEKVTLTMTILVVLILTMVSIVNKIALRSRLWIVLIGIYIALDNILVPLLIISICQVIDELVISPIKRTVNIKLKINKEIDSRGS